MSCSWTDKPIASISADASMDHWDMFNDFTNSQAINLLGQGKNSYNLRLACEEIFSNIVRHAGSESGPSDVVLSVDFFRKLSGKETDDDIGNHASEVMVQISDNGPFFDPHFQTPRRVNHDLSISDRPIGGLGLFLVQQSVDLAEYAWVNNTNRYRLYINNAACLPESSKNQDPSR